MSESPHLVTVRGGPTGYRQEINANGHALTSDEPPDLGGENAGPNPYDLLLAALGSCTSITLRMYAERRQLPLDGVEVNLRHQKIHAKDCQECQTETGFVDVIERDIVLKGDLSQAQKDKLLSIADKCPVHRTLNREVRVHTTLR